MDPEFQVFGELFLELSLVFLVFCNFCEHFQAPFDNVFLDDLQHFVLLQHFSGNVQRQVVGVDDALDEAQPLRDEFLAVVHDEDPPDLQLDVVFLLLALEQVVRRAFGCEQHGLELELPLDAEVFDCEVVLPVVGQ